MTYRELESLLWSACEDARAAGLKLVTGMFGGRDLGRCCAVGAVDTGWNLEGRPSPDVALGHCADSWTITGVADGFDGKDAVGLLANYRAGYAIGKRLRAHYVEGLR